MTGVAAAARAAALDRLFDVRGMRVVVTGAASGLGFAMAEVMAECGATVLLSDRNEETLVPAQQRLGGREFSVHAKTTDVSDKEQVEQLFAEAERLMGGVDVAFVNAGIGAGNNMWDKDGRLETFSESDWERVIRTNLNGAFWTLQAAAAVMKQQRSGSIIVTGSTAGLRAEPMVGYAYLAAKSALTNIVRQAALELAPYGVRVNAIAPGPMKTNIGGPVPKPPEVIEAWMRSIPFRRYGDPEAVQGVALLLASPAASFVTGSVYGIDGGAFALTQCASTELPTP